MGLLHVSHKAYQEVHPVNRDVSLDYRRLATMAVLIALSVVMLLVFRMYPFPAVPFLVYEPADVALLVAGFALGPGSGMLATAIVCAIQAPLHPEGGWFGAVMHLISSGALVGVASVVYARNKTRRGAYLGLAAGAVAMVAVMIAANLVLTPVFYNLPVSAVTSVMGWIIAFNVLKAGANAIITALVYKPISMLIRRTAG